MNDPLEQAYEDARNVLEQLASPVRSDSATPPDVQEGIPFLEPASGPSPLLHHEWPTPTLIGLIESLPDALVVINAEGRIVMCNRQTESLFGYPREELIGQFIELLVPPRFRRPHVQYRTDYFLNPHSRPMGVGVELFGQTKDGEEIPVEISLSPLHTEEGVLVTSTIRDVTERKKEQAKFRSLVEQIPAVTFTAPLDETSPQLYVSPYIQDLLGFTQKEWLEDPVLWYRQLHPDDRERWNARFAPTCAMGTPFREVYRFIAKDGRVVWVQGAANVVRDEHGRALFLQGLAFDITSIKEAEETHRRLAAIVASSDDAIIGKTLEGIVVSWNRGAQAIYGYTESEMVGQTIGRLFPPEQADELNSILQRLKAGVTIPPFETVRVRKDGTRIDVALTISAIKDAEGKILGASTIARDITQKKRAQETLREQARLLALEAEIGVILTQTSELRSMLQECTVALVEHLGVAFARIWTLNHNDNVLELQASAGMYTHLDGPHGRIPLGQHKIGQIAQEKHSHFTNDVANDPRISDQEWASREGMIAFAGCPLVVDENVIGVMALFSRGPLTEKVHEALELIAAHVSLGIKRKQTEAELEQRVEQRTRELAQSMEALKEKKEELEQFAHVAAHDFNEPLRSIVNYPQKLWDTYQDQLDEQATRWLERTLAGVRRMRRLIEDVQQYSRVLRRDLAVAPVDCNSAFANACANLDAVIQANEARVTADALPTVQGYETDLILLFQNLINNAIKFRSADRSPVVHAWAERQETGWRISVRDNGIGMESKYLVKVFGLGDRLHSASKYPGTGFGLAICEKIVRTHKGRIWAESELGVGSTFHFVIPEE